MENKLKTIECVNALIKDLYVDLREKVNRWASLTGQTAQARMGYIGQHLVSAVTGYQGSKSGARGKDLIISETEFAEIKTCSKVDQLGCCSVCGTPISSVESRCPKCGSQKIERRDDSKWLISIKSEYPEIGTPDSEGVLVNINKPKWYFFVLFEYEDIQAANSPIVITIYRVDPKVDGFTLCMIDYFYNIRGSAPFNMWPHMLKFALCNPGIIYKSKISINGDIETLHFCPDDPYVEPFVGLKPYSRSTALKGSQIIKDIHDQFSEYFENDPTNKEVLDTIDDYVKHMNQAKATQLIARGFYKSPLKGAKEKLNDAGRDFPQEFLSYLDYLQD